MLDHLAQRVQLHRGQAATIHPYLVRVQQSLLLRDLDRGPRLSAAQVLSLKPLAALIKRLDRLILRDQAPAPSRPPSRSTRRKARKPAEPKAHQLRVPYDELTTVRLYYGALLASAAHCPYRHTELATVLMQFHQPSLNLEQHIALPPPAGPGCQTMLL